MIASGYVIREANIQDAEGIAEVHVKSWQTSYAGIIDPEFLENISYEGRLQWRKKVLQSDTFQLVATFEDKVVGFADAGFAQLDSNAHHGDSDQKLSKVGAIYAIYLLQEHQGQGIGRKLFTKCRQWFQEQHMDSFFVWTFKDNIKARNFYEKQGGYIMGERTTTIGAQEFLEYYYLFIIP